MSLYARTAGAQITHNDGSCDISVTPAATLLLPYFEVGIDDAGPTTLFTVTNTSALPQIARATIWTDLAYPVLTFDFFLTGYDITTIDLKKILGTGRLPGSRTSPTGPLSASNYANPNHLATMPVDCGSRATEIPRDSLEALRAALTTGLGGYCSGRPVGSFHERIAAGYITIDVVATCSTLLPTQAGYYLSDLLFDNVLTGDWMIVSSSSSNGHYAGGSPMVHIRAVPEGGRAGSVVATNLPYTFYDRLTNTVPANVPRTVDRRQPLPSTFAARVLNGSYKPIVESDLLIWREAVNAPNAPCREYGDNERLLAEAVLFDEHENAFVFTLVVGIPFSLPPAKLPAATSVRPTGGSFPYMSSPRGDSGGWLFLNLDNGGSPAYSAIGAPRGGMRSSQNWVVTRMYSESRRYSVAFDAAVVQNGCSPPRRPGTQIGPE